MTFEDARGVKQCLRRQPAGNGLIKPQARYRCCRTAAEPGSGWDIAVHFYRERRERAPMLAGEKPKRALDVILAIEFPAWEFEM